MLFDFNYNIYGGDGIRYFTFLFYGLVSVHVLMHVREINDFVDFLYTKLVRFLQLIILYIT